MRRSKREESQSGVALFMVIGAVSVLSILVTEFTYISQLNQKIAFDHLDQLKAQSLAKSGLKISLLRLKAFQLLKQQFGGGSQGGGAGAAAGIAIPRALLDKVWNFPFFFPLPKNLPGMTLADKELVEKFDKSTSLDGKFSAVIESESARYNLNLILAPFAPPAAAATGPSGPPGQPGQPPGTPPPAAGATGPTSPAFSAEEARKSLFEYLNQIVTHKFEADPDFATEYRDLRVDELTDSIAAWADFGYTRQFPERNDKVPMKRAPFYSLNELRMLPQIDDKLFDLFAPALTATATPGINVNTMQEPTLRAIVPGIRDEEVKEFFKFRDDPQNDNSFKASDDFFKWIQGGVGTFRNDPAEVDRYKQSLDRRGVRIVVDETQFKITVQAQVNQTTRTLEAWVTLGGKKKDPANPNGPPGSQPPPGVPASPGQPQAPTAPDPGLRITFMRIL